MSVEAALFNYLSGISGIAAIVGTRIHPLETPQNGAFPCITYQTISFQHTDSLQGSSGLGTARIQINCWARTVDSVSNGYDSALALRDAVRDATDGFSGTWDTTEIDHAFIVDEGDLFYPSAGVESDKTYGRRIDLEVWHAEAKPAFTP